MPPIWTAPRTWNVGEVVTESHLNTHLRDNLEYLKQRDDAMQNLQAQHILTETTTNSTAFTDLHPSTFTHTLITSGAPVMIGFNGSWKSDTVGADCCLDIAVNGVRIGNITWGSALFQNDMNGKYMPVTLLTVRPLIAGTYIIKPQWRTSGGTLTMSFLASFWVIELR